jgi:mediator of RNA polymerase II transcription subunit 28
VENTIANFIDLARQMECFFLQKRFQLSVLKPELLLKEENIDLRHEIARKDELLKKHAGKIAKWKEILNDNSPASILPNQMPPNQQMPPQNQPPMIPGAMPPQMSQMAQMTQMSHGMQPGFGISHAPQRPPFGHMSPANPLAFLEKTTNNIMEPR